DLRKEYAGNQAKLADRVKGVWGKLGVDTDLVRRLETYAGSLLDKKDLTAAIAVLSAGTRHLEAKGYSSPQLIAALNSLKATDERRKPKDAADRAERSEHIYKLGQETIAAARLVPDDPVFLADRVFVLTEGAKLVHMAVCAAHDPKADAWSEHWDPRAD